MIEKLKKQFEGKDLWEDEIMDEYEVKMFDWEEYDDEETFNKWKRSKEKKNYIVPFESDDDSYIFILVPKNKMEDGGMMAKGGATKKIEVIVYGDKKLKYTNYDINELLDDNYLYSSDDLPKWLIAVRNKGNINFPKNKEQVISLLKQILNTNENVLIDVDSNKPAYLNKIVIGKEQIMEDGGSIEEQNNEMLQSNIKEMKHHTDELDNIVTSSTEVEPWVIAKTERASTDLSDVTHYLDGRTSRYVESDTYFAYGGELNEDDIDDYARKLYKPIGVNSVAEKQVGAFKEGARYANKMADGGEIIKSVEYLKKSGWSEERINNYLLKDNIYNKLDEAFNLAQQLLANVEPKVDSLDIFTKEKLVNGTKSIWQARSDFAVMNLEKGGYMEDGGMMAKGGMTAKDKKIADHIIKTFNMDEPGMAPVYANQLRREEARLNKSYGRDWQKTMTPADKVNKFLEAVRVADNSIQLKDIKVEASPRGNWVVYEHGKVIMTVNHDMLDEETIRTYNLEHHN